MNERPVKFEDIRKVEQGPRPEKLYRSFVVDPENLNVDMFELPLVMGQINKEDPTKTVDGNEAGVYMSTNPTMVASAGYANKSHSAVTVPQHAGKYGLESSIPLPGCGVVVEINTEGLDIRKPEITDYLRGHYNNGFEGEEWIADQVPSNSYCVQKFILSRGPNDPERKIIEVDPADPDGLIKAVEESKKFATECRMKAERFKEFLEGLTDAERNNSFILEKKWVQFQG